MVNVRRAVILDPSTMRRPLTPDDAPAVEFLTSILIPQAVHDGILSARDGTSLAQLSADLLREETGAPPAVQDATVHPPHSFPKGAPVERAHPQQRLEHQASAPAAEPVRKSPPPAPSPAAPPLRSASPSGRPTVERTPSRRSALAGAVSSDLALHGLSYLGVLLLFIGCFGLVAFAFGDIAEGARPVAEVAIAMSPFVAAAVLLRRGARVAGRSLELAGGLLLPVMAMTSLLDGVAFPPDLVGVPLVVALTVIPVACAGGYWLWMRRHPSSALRFLVAPMLWLAAGMAAMGIGREIPSGRDVAGVTAAQVAVITVALAGSLMLARVRPKAPLARPTKTAALVGSVVVAMLALLTWFAEGWPRAAILVTAVAGVMVVDLLDGRLPARLVGVLQVTWWAVAMLALAAGSTDGEAAPVAALAAVGFAALIERVVLVRPSRLAGALAGLGLMVALTAIFADAWWAFTAWTVVTVWAHARRVRPYPRSSVPPQLVDIAAGVAPFGSLVALGLATRTWGLALVVAAVIVLLAVIPAQRPVLRRDAADSFWATWWAIAAPATVAASLLATSVNEGQPDGLRWIAAANACLAVAFAFGPTTLRLRPWLVLGMASWAWFAFAASLGLSVLATTTPPAVVALVCVLVAHLAGARLEGSLAAHVGWSGHALAMVVLLPAGLTWAGVVAAGLATLGGLPRLPPTPVTAPRSQPSCLLPDASFPPSWLGWACRRPPRSLRTRQA